MPMLDDLDRLVFFSPWAYAAVGIVIALLVALSWQEAGRERGSLYWFGARINFAAASILLMRAYWVLLIEVWRSAQPLSHVPAAAERTLLQLSPVFQLALVIGVPLALVFGLYASYRRHEICLDCVPFIDPDVFEDLTEDVLEEGGGYVGDALVSFYQTASDGDGGGFSFGGMFDGIGNLFSGSSSSSSSSSDGDGGVMLGVFVVCIVILALCLGILTVWLIVVGFSSSLRERAGQMVHKRQTAYAQARHQARHGVRI